MVWLAAVWRQFSESGHQFGMSPQVNGLMVTGGLRRMRLQAVVATPCLGGPQRTRAEVTAAVGANVLEQTLSTADTEGALKRTDAGIRGVGRKIHSTVFAAGSELKHRTLNHRQPTAPGQCGQQGLPP